MRKPPAITLLMRVGVTMVQERRRVISGTVTA